jgi:hypothetical protein
MDLLKAEADAAISAPPPADDAAAAEEAAAAQERGTRLKSLKRAYKTAYDEMKMVQSDSEYTSGLVEACTRELVAAFTAWYDAQYCSGGGGGGSAGERVSDGSVASVASAPSVVLLAAASPASWGAATYSAPVELDPEAALYEEARRRAHKAAPRAVRAPKLAFAGPAR